MSCCYNVVLCFGYVKQCTCGSPELGVCMFVQRAVFLCCFDLERAEIAMISDHASVGGRGWSGSSREFQRFCASGLEVRPRARDVDWREPPRADWVPNGF